MKFRFFKFFLIPIVCCIILGFVILSPGQAKAEGGCENNPVGYHVYACTALGYPCLNERNIFTHAWQGCIPYGATIYVTAQYDFTAFPVFGSTIWDQLQDGNVVSDYYVNTGNYAVFSPPIPQCFIGGGPGGFIGGCS